jgi:HAE1 family hydrophobic/amphiphilic exporter-1
MKTLLFGQMPMVKSIHLGDLATIELGSEFFDIYSNLDGHPSAAIVLKQNYGSNASEGNQESKSAADGNEG